MPVVAVVVQAQVGQTLRQPQAATVVRVLMSQVLLDSKRQLYCSAVAVAVQD
jgi:hypothetical protein